MNNKFIRDLQPRFIISSGSSKYGVITDHNSPLKLIDIETYDRITLLHSLKLSIKNKNTDKIYKILQTINSTILFRVNKKYFGYIEDNKIIISDIKDYAREFIGYNFNNESENEDENSEDEEEEEDVSGASDEDEDEDVSGASDEDEDEDNKKNNPILLLEWSSDPPPQKKPAINIKRFNSDNPYIVLGIPSGSNKKKIHKAYQKLALIYHPDKGGNTKIFQKISAAYKKFEKKFENKNENKQKTNNIKRESNLETEYKRKKYKSPFLKSTITGLNKGHIVKNKNGKKVGEVVFYTPNTYKSGEIIISKIKESNKNYRGVMYKRNRNSKYKIADPKKHTFSQPTGSTEPTEPVPEQNSFFSRFIGRKASKNNP